MNPYATADADETNQSNGTTGRNLMLGRPITLWFVTGMVALSGTTALLWGDTALYPGSQSASGLAGLVTLVLAGGLWYRQKWAIVCAVVLQALGLLLAFITVNFPGVVSSIVLLGAMFAIPRRVWH